MLNTNSVNINGVSKIDGKDAAYFNASLSFGKNGNYSITKNITDKDLYLENQEQCNADYEEFETAVVQYAAQLSDGEQITSK